MFWRLGITRFDDREDRALVAAIVRALQDSGAPLDRFYFDWFGGIAPAAYGAEFDEVKRSLSPHTPRTPRDHAYWSDAEPCSMLIEEVEAIWSAIADSDDWSPFEAKIAAIRRMGEAMAADRTPAA
jgi:hypothetical protein